MRKDHVALRRGTVDAACGRRRSPGARRDAGIFAFERVAPDETALVVLNASEQESETCAPTADGGACLKTTLPAGSTLEPT